MVPEEETISLGSVISDKVTRRKTTNQTSNNNNNNEVITSDS